MTPPIPPKPPAPDKPPANVKLVAVDLSTGTVTRVTLQFWLVSTAVWLGVYAVLQALTGLVGALR